MSNAYEIIPVASFNAKRKAVPKIQKMGATRQASIILIARISVYTSAWHAGHTECDFLYKAMYIWPQPGHPDGLYPVWNRAFILLIIHNGAII